MLGIRPSGWISLWLVALSVGVASAEEPSVPDADQRGRHAAVTLNYCRASFHRIRRYQSKRVLIEEQEKILNNLNLNGIGDEEVIKLYSAVLDEISKVQIADREVAALADKYRKGLHRQLGVTALAMGTHMALGSVDGAVRTGVNSWLDYRDLTWTREFDAWKVEKDRMQAVVDKSSKFLDTFWKLAQAKNISDKWLVRGDDLDALEDAVREPDPDRRFRVLKRMEPFMECYPPYWYFLARSAQSRGEYDSATKTYDRVAALARGHFRKDDMLAAAFANKALICEHQKLNGADGLAREALTYSSAVWEANLICAHVLEKHGHEHEAEDAILRNLDVDLEKPVSALSLVGLYHRTNRKSGMEKLLATDSIVNVLPVHALLMCIEKTDAERVSVPVAKKLRDSMMVTIEPRFGLDDVIVSCDSSWLPHSSKARLGVNGTDGALQWIDTNSVAMVEPQRPRFLDVSLSTPNQAAMEKATQQSLAPAEFTIRFKSAFEAGHPLQASSASLFGATLAFVPNHSADARPILVTLGNATHRRGCKPSVWGTAAAPVEITYGTTTISLTDSPTVSMRGKEPRRQDPSAVGNDVANKDGANKDSDRKKPRAKILDVIPVSERELEAEVEPTEPTKEVPPPPPEELDGKQ